MQSLKRAFALAAIAMIPFAGASAQTITSISAEFDNSLPVGAATINNTNPDEILVCWPSVESPDCSTLGPGLSGYGFERSTTPFDPGFAPFALGTFTHYNFVIDPPPPGSLTSVDLLFSFSIAGANPVSFGDSWTLSHEETPNSGVCPYPGGQKCADRVTFALTSGGTATQFEYNGSLYTITLFGFGATAEAAALNPAFVTFENQNNVTTLWAQITPVSTVPEPATMTLLATGLVGLAAARRKRHKV